MSRVYFLPFFCSVRSRLYTPFIPSVYVCVCVCDKRRSMHFIHVVQDISAHYCCRFIENEKARHFCLETLMAGQAGNGFHCAATREVFIRAVFAIIIERSSTE